MDWIAIECGCINLLGPRGNRRYFPDDIFKWIFLNENVWISIKISLKFVPRGPISNTPALVQIMAWRRPGDKPLSEPVMVSLLMHICVTRPQWVNLLGSGRLGFYLTLTHLPLDKNGRHFADDIFRGIYVNEKLCILIKISLKFVLKGQIDNIFALV